MSDISDRLLSAILESEKSYQTLSSETGIPKSTIQRYATGNTGKMDVDLIQTLCVALHKDPSVILGWRSPEHTSNSDAVVIPVLGRVAAGIPLTAAEYIIDTEEISEAMAADGEYFGLQVKGDSMEPRIRNGDVVIVRKQSDADDGDLVIALINGDDAVVKRLKKYKDGIGLISNNPAFDPMYFSNAEIDSKPVEIIGKVKELRAKF